jgi:hypothetical protein
MTKRRQTGLAMIGAAVIVLIFVVSYWVFSLKKTLDERSKAAQTPQFITLTPQLITDYLANPGIGWQNINFEQPYPIPETIAYRRGAHTVPNLPQYTWKDVNPSEGTFDWRMIDRDIALAASQGKQFSFRVVTMRGEGFGNAQVPQWVLNKGAQLFSTGAPDYSNCTYETEWAKFVNALRARYDGNPNIAFIDISGYGNFNEWSWQTEQTQFDPDPLNPRSVDGQARKHLVDMFLGTKGQSRTVQCRTNTTQTTSFRTITYTYPGFQSTQLVMPFAGIRQSSEYVFSQRKDVGLRYDCLGRTGSTDFVMTRVGSIINQLWSQAPIVFEYCGAQSPTSAVITEADKLLKASHGSVVHDNFPRKNTTTDVANLMNLQRNVGYRYYLQQAQCLSPVTPEQAWDVRMKWQNIGSAPSYPKMGQNLTLHIYLYDANGQTLLQDWPVTTTISSWLPANPLPGSAPINQVNTNLPLPINLSVGSYQTKIAIIDTRTHQPINLSIAGRDAEGRYPFCPLNIELAEASITPTPSTSPNVSPSINPSESPTATPSGSPTATPTSSPSESPSVAPTATPSETPSVSPSESPATSPTSSPSTNPGVSPSPSSTPSPTASPIASVTPSPSATPLATPTPTPTATPTGSPLASATPTGSPIASITPVPSISPSPSVTPSSSPTPLPLACMQITTNVTNPRLGQAVNFTCGQVAGANRYEFRYKIINTSFFGQIPTLEDNVTTSESFIISEPGSYKVQCRPCFNEACAMYEPW